MQYASAAVLQNARVVPGPDGRVAQGPDGRVAQGLDGRVAQGLDGRVAQDLDQARLDYQNAIEIFVGVIVFLIMNF